MPEPKSRYQPDDIASMARAFSLWLNSTYDPDLDPEAWFHRRVGKIHEEAGEVREATGAYFHENPRKERGSLDDVIKELADCVGAALGAIEHLTGHNGRSLIIATNRVREVCERVGVRWACSDCGAPLHDADESRISGLCLFCLNGPLPGTPVDPRCAEGDHDYDHDKCYSCGAPTPTENTDSPHAEPSE